MVSTADAKRHAAKITRQLAKHYPDATCSLDFRSPLELLVATILSAQCTDSRVNQVTQTLFPKYPTVSHYARANLSELEQDIRSTGFFRSKAKNIQKCCEILLERHGGKVPEKMEQLVELPGIGRKTANVVLSTAFGIAVGVAVDTHVARIARRLGLSREKSPEKIERDILEQVAKKQWLKLSHRLIQHGRRCCTARKPHCVECPLGSFCPRIGVEGKPSRA